MQFTTLLALPLASLAVAQTSSSAASSSRPATTASATSSSAPAASTSVAAGQTVRVNVGQSGLTYSPNIVQAAPGAKVEFHYFPRNHSVVQSSFQQPCQPLAGNNGVNSGFQPVAAGEGPNVFTVTVNDTNPVWLYCAQTNGAHCQNGMSMVINQPAGANSLAAYQANSKNVSNSTTLANVQGGVFSANRSNSTSTGNATSTRPGAAAGTTAYRTTPGGARYTGGAAVEAVSWGVLGAGAAVAGFFL